jgi:translation initiation factor IF-1
LEDRPASPDLRSAALEARREVSVFRVQCSAGRQRGALALGSLRLRLKRARVKCQDGAEPVNHFCGPFWVAPKT